MNYQMKWRWEILSFGPVVMGAVHMKAEIPGVGEVNLRELIRAGSLFPYVEIERAVFKLWLEFENIKSEAQSHDQR